MRPGLYAVTFTHSAFKTLRLENVQVSWSRTIVVGVECAEGSPTETMTVARAGGSVDARSATRQMVLEHDVITAIPNRRNYNSLLVVVPGVTTDRDDVVIDPLAATFPIHGGRGG